MTSNELLSWPFRDLPTRQGTVDGIPWAIRPISIDVETGWGGYAQIPAEGHPWCMLYDVAEIDDELRRHVSVEVTFTPDSDPDAGCTLVDHRGWIGFDTLAAFGPTRSWTADRVAEEARALARAIAEASRR